MAGRPKDPKVKQKVFNKLQSLLEEQHFHDITIDQIAERSGVSKTTIYRRWADKSFIIIDMFIEQTKMYEPEPVSLYQDLYHFLIHVMQIYKTPLGIAVMEVLMNKHHQEARARFMDLYFNRKRKVLKDIIEPHISKSEEDMFIDLIFAPIYFNILIKPDDLDERYIERMLKRILKVYEQD